MEQIESVLFDWDGTLIDSHAAGFAASMEVFKHFGLDVDRERYQESYSPNWYDSYRRLGLDPLHWNDADRLWRQTYARRASRLYPFARSSLTTLRDRGYRLGLVTSGNRDRVTGELERHSLHGFFSQVICCEDTKEKKPHPEPLRAALRLMKETPERAAYVGDRPEDVQMGNEAGSYTIAVESPYSTLSSLEEASPDLLLPDVGHLPRQLGTERRRATRIPK